MKERFLSLWIAAALPVVGCSDEVSLPLCEDDPRLELADAGLSWAGSIDNVLPYDFAHDEFVTGAELRLVPTDANGDGQLDLLVFANSGTSCQLAGGIQPILLLYGHSDGTFSEAVELVPPTSVCDLTASDLDDDGSPDIVVLDGEAGSVDLYFGPIDAGGSAAATASIPGDFRFSSVAELDDDQYQDLIVAGEDPNGWAIAKYQNNGDRTFTEIDRTVLDTPRLSGLRVGDVDGDGTPDLVIRPCTDTFWCSLEFLANVTETNLEASRVVVPTEHDWYDELRLLPADADTPLEIVAGSREPWIIDLVSASEAEFVDIPPPSIGWLQPRLEYPKTPVYAFSDLGADGLVQLIYGGSTYENALGGRAANIGAPGCGGMLLYNDVTQREPTDGPVAQFYADGWEVYAIATGRFDGDPVSDIAVLRPCPGHDWLCVSVLPGRPL